VEEMAGLVKGQVRSSPLGAAGLGGVNSYVEVHRFAMQVKRAH